VELSKCPHGDVTVLANACNQHLMAAFVCCLERCSHLRICIEPEWQTFFGNSKAAARADLMQLAELLGCREKLQPHPRHEGVCLARGIPHILSASERAGGVQALAAADPAAAACLGHVLMLAVGDIRCSWLSDGMICRAEHAFAKLGPSNMRGAIAGLREGITGSSQLACTAIRLTHALLRPDLFSKASDKMARTQEAVAAAALGQVCRLAFMWLC
jgi:hypothetical protein